MRHALLDTVLFVAWEDGATPDQLRAFPTVLEESKNQLGHRPLVVLTLRSIPAQPGALRQTLELLTHGSVRLHVVLPVPHAAVAPLRGLLGGLVQAGRRNEARRVFLHMDVLGALVQDRKSLNVAPAALFQVARERGVV